MDHTVKILFNTLDHPASYTNLAPCLGGHAVPGGRDERGGGVPSGRGGRAARRAGGAGAAAQAAPAGRAQPLQAAGRGRRRRPVDRREGPHARHHAAAQGHRRRRDHEAQVRLTPLFNLIPFWSLTFPTKGS